MVSYDKEYGVIGSFLEPIPFINNIESRFDSNGAFDWLYNNLQIPIASATMYVLLVFLGIQWMKKREPFKLQQPLQLWNLGLAIFSLCGVLSVFPHLVHGAYKQGLFYSVCLANGTNRNPHVGLWCYIFVISKIFEFIDTAFLVLRKKPVNFLHWYHHASVLLISWYVFGTQSTAIGLWYSGVNYLVHTIMYSYYFLRAMSVPVPSNVALLITILQIAQMILGLFISITAFYQHVILQKQCTSIPYAIYGSIFIYISYCYLFTKLFVGRYVSKGKKKTQ